MLLEERSQWVSFVIVYDEFRNGVQTWIHSYVVILMILLLDRAQIYVGWGSREYAGLSCPKSVVSVRNSACVLATKTLRQCFL